MISLGEPIELIVMIWEGTYCKVWEKIVTRVLGVHVVYGVLGLSYLLDWGLSKLLLRLGLPRSILSRGGGKSLMITFTPLGVPTWCLNMVSWIIGLRIVPDRLYDIPSPRDRT